MQVIDDNGGSDVLSLDHQLCLALYTCANQVVRLYRSALQPVGLTFTQYLVLLALWEKSPRNISELAHVMEVESNTVTPMIKRMELLGLVSRSRNLIDERQVWVAIAENGRRLQPEILAMRQQMTQRLDLPDDELVEIREKVEHFAERVTGALQELAPHGPAAALGPASPASR